MKAILAVTLALSLGVGVPGPLQAQKVYRIGALVADDQFVPAFEGFKKRMGKLAYTEGKNVKYEFYNAQGSRESLKRLAQKLVQDASDLIVTSSTTATAPVAKASAGTNIPVVFLSAGNPLAFVKSYASSGNNLTGISTSSIDLTGKRMELLKDLDPKVKRVIALHHPQGVSYKEILQALEEAAKKMDLILVNVNVSTDQERRSAINGLSRTMGEAIFIPPDAFVIAAIREIVHQSIKERLPTIAPTVVDIQKGALATYGADYHSLGQQGAILVDKILRGARPMDIPIEMPFKLKLVINLKTARAIGLKIPRQVLIRADEVIE
ncbi:MAG: ABC transporter substrate-binding protein [Deltaproteobacteria bacterium]|nr:ABC transporter substrate-binding protein [Deltaproteobacteria bacterium]